MYFYINSYLSGIINIDVRAYYILMMQPEFANAITMYQFGQLEARGDLLAIRTSSCPYLLLRCTYVAFYCSSFAIEKAQLQIC